MYVRTCRIGLGKKVVKEICLIFLHIFWRNFVACDPLYCLGVFPFLSSLYIYALSAIRSQSLQKHLINDNGRKHLICY